jgi:hypothetical protein
VDRADAPAVLGLGLVEFGPAAAGDEAVGAFVACGRVSFADICERYLAELIKQSLRASSFSI